MEMYVDECFHPIVKLAEVMNPADKVFYRFYRMKLPTLPTSTSSRWCT